MLFQNEKINYVSQIKRTVSDDYKIKYTMYNVHIAMPSLFVKKKYEVMILSAICNQTLKKS